MNRETRPQICEGCGRPLDLDPSEPDRVLCWDCQLEEEVELDFYEAELPY